MDLQQGNQSVYVYSKLFNHLTQYALEQVDTNKKKKYHFMNDLSTKLQEHLALNADRTFLELVSNTIVADDAISAHQESKKKVLTAPSGSAPHKYWIVCAPHHPHRSIIIVSWPPVHRRIRISCLELWHPHRQ
jgi:hypothetical protein